MQNPHYRWPLLSLGLALISLMMLSSCYYDNEEDLYQFITDPPCDTVNVSYAQTILPVLQTHCYSCHDAGTKSGNVDLETFSALKQVAGDGRLYGSIAHLEGFSAMPKGGNSLADCAIKQTKAWIDSGSPQN
jgi:hypothetical protein